MHLSNDDPCLVLACKAERDQLRARVAELELLEKKEDVLSRTLEARVRELEAQIRETQWPDAREQIGLLEARIAELEAQLDNAETCSQCLQLPKARDRIAELEAQLAAHARAGCPQASADSPPSVSIGEQEPGDG